MARPLDPRVVPYPAERVARYLADGSWSSTPTAERFRSVAQMFGPRVAVIDQWSSMTYVELDDLSDRAAAGLLDLGIRPGDPILFQVDNSIPAVVAWYAVLKAGAVPVATLAGHRAHEIRHVAERVGAVGHIVDDSRPERFDMVSFAREQAASSSTLRHLFTVRSERSAEQVDVTPIEGFGSSMDPLVARRAVAAVQAELGPEDVAVYQLSGGTTGVPKVIPRLHGEYWNNARAWAHALGRTEDSVTCHAAPIIHNAGITCALHSTHSVGGCVVLAPADRVIALRMMREHRVDDTLMPHGMFSWICSTEYELAAEHLKTVILSGAKVPEDVFARVERFGARVGQTFGMGEGLFTLTPFAAARELRSTTVGTPLVEADEIRILEPGGERELADGEIGELACRGWYTIPGYFDSAEHNAVAFTSDGFYRTGDLGRVRVRDGQRHLSIDGRIKDVINRGGEKINAEELELLLHQHPDVTDVAVVAMPDERLGERVCAYVVSTDPSLGVPELQVHLEALGVAKYKWPERVEVVGLLPRTQVGKLDKKELREDVAGKVAPASS
jgi:2,3-dihydroxybenzoate-AMP ligase